MKRMVVVLLMVAACAAEDPETADTTQAGTSSQGTSSQGTSSQGTSSQGTSSQGTSSQGTSSQGTTSSGTTVSGAHVVGTALQFWQPTTGGMWKLVTPNRTCVYTSDRLFQLSCTNVNLATQPSPLAGSRWPTTFMLQTGPGSYTLKAVTLQIGQSATQVGAVTNDPSTAMYDLKGTGASGALVGCLDPNGCRRNSDLFLYDVKVIDSSGTVTSLCPSGEHAIALQGTWDTTATFHASSQFTFACTSGTIAKCVRWGYRPWASALSDYDGSGATPTPLADYHQACVHAAMADYCGNGHSFTKDGTVIDISDQGGFIKSTDSLLPSGAHYTATTFESMFDLKGAWMIDHMRYQELNNPNNSSYDLADWCPTTFTLSGDGFPANYYRATDPGAWLRIESTPACAHSEFEVGKWLHASCSKCTDQSTIPAYCTDPTDSRGWDAGCVAAAQTCTAANRMAPTHGECTTGVGLNQYDSGCTLKMSLKGYASCFATWDWSAWSSACVSAANQICTGGREHWTVSGNVGFCGQVIPLMNGI